MRENIEPLKEIHERIKPLLDLFMTQKLFFGLQPIDTVPEELEKLYRSVSPALCPVYYCAFNDIDGASR